MKLISKGAEADVYDCGNYVLKKRVAKGYRIKQLDESIRKQRTRTEARILEKAKRAGVNVPEVQKIESAFYLTMEKIEGMVLKQILTKNNSTVYAKQVAEQISKLHKADLVHGDLTTSNMIATKNELFLIDFGLAKHSSKEEDKAVDLHLLEETLRSTHSNIAEQFLKTFYKSYKNQQVLKRLEQLKARGRYKK